MEEQMTEFFRHPRGVVGLDVSVRDDSDTEQRTPPYATPLPDTFSGYTKFLIRYVRDRPIFTLEEAVQKCATIPARTFRLADRGLLKPGAYADIVLMDLERLSIVGHSELSATYPEGVRYVLVNGELVVDRGRHTGARPGLVLTR
jgi:N-acyl-D-aspartate/D-glutamate deacylase